MFKYALIRYQRRASVALVTVLKEDIPVAANIGGQP